ncbi:MAG: cytochrome-c oxidase [Aphanocapsa feldmannii 277cV]|uniref:Cytochrome-c oxidase n=2 Tax=Aphanocapsa feldmannii TaxID=192050 RepID=A0A524RPI8_9CHRO|nr:MAG: cytochrome-c oxidase [Aphanocapsa feldmannii 288cV]TGG93733.1 MAG: cytochrome-c oxidase [Aphanocapsa feldmannii 277cV]TGH27611.1 MAG: cytochrome-c oxidase [Aphanocapsa feldmannii 277cI]
MLVIEITNSRDVMRQRVGKLGERLIGRVVDHEAQVEKAVMHELETAFRSFGIEANIFSVEGLEMVGDKLELRVKIRDVKQVDLSPQA